MPREWIQNAGKARGRPALFSTRSGGQNDASPLFDDLIREKFSPPASNERLAIRLSLLVLKLHNFQFHVIIKKQNTGALLMEICYCNS